MVAIGVAIAIGGRAWDQFSSSDVQFPNQPEQHFSQLNGAGRHDYFRVAIDSFDEKPLLGSGAGTYQFAWDRHRTIAQPVHNAHSLYLEAFAELGVVGGLLVLALVGLLLWTGFAAWRAAPHPQRERYAALFAATLAFAVVAGLDWFWEIAGLGAVFFLAAGVLVAARCAQLPPPASADIAEGEERRFGLAVAGLVVAWIAAVALIGPLLVEREINASQSAAADGDLDQRRRPRRDGALDRALRRLSLRPARAARRGAGRLRDRDRTAHASDRPRGPQLAALLPTL